MFVMMFTMMTFVLPMLSPFVMMSIPLAPPMMAPAISTIVIITIDGLIIDGLDMDGARDIHLPILVMVIIVVMASTKRDGYPWFGYKLIQR